MFKSGCIAAIIAGTFLTGCVAKNIPSQVTSSMESVDPPHDFRRGVGYGAVRKRTQGAGVD